MRVFGSNAIWRNIAKMLVGSDWEDDMYAQDRIWLRCLLGKDEPDSDSADSDSEFEWEKPVQARANPFQILWSWEVSVKTATSKLIPYRNERYRYTRVVNIVIGCLGPFNQDSVLAEQ